MYPYRRDFSKRQTIDIPNLLELQVASYKNFLQFGVSKKDKLPVGLHAAFIDAFPISSYDQGMELHYVDYKFEEPSMTPDECRIGGYTYSAQLIVKFRLIAYDLTTGDKSAVKSVKEQDIYMGEVPLMTDDGCFVINGTDRVVVSQLHRSPGVFFEHDKGKTHSSGKYLYSARIIPYRGSWLDFEFDSKDCIFIRIDRKRKLPATILLRAVGMGTNEILESFFDFNELKVSTGGKITMLVAPDRIKGEVFPFDILDADGKVLLEADKIASDRHVRAIKKAGITKLQISNTSYLVGKLVAAPIYSQEDKSVLIADLNQPLTEDIINKIIEAGIKSFKILCVNDLDRGPYISNTLSIDPCKNQIEALMEIYRVIRPGEPPTKDMSENLFNSLFFSEDKYDLSVVGRMKMQKRLGRKNVKKGTGRVLSKEDIIDVIRVLIDIRDGKGTTDDTDNLGNKRIRTVEEMVQNQVGAILYKIERLIKDKLSSGDPDILMPQDVINNKPVTAIRDFFSSNPLSQFADQVNPLALVTHLRRISALGPGGLTRERAGFEVRDVHNTHYGRICPIETPEGPNIGLINSLALYAKTNEYGFLETPYKVVQNMIVQDEVVYLSAMDEASSMIAQASAKVDKNGQIIGDLIPCRYKGEFIFIPPEEVKYIDVSPRQIVSVAAALIPFLEHDDANRALMGSNMQRQAVPLLKSESPLVGTGMEKVVATDVAAAIVATRSGTVSYVDASKIMITVIDSDAEAKSPKIEVDNYVLKKYARSNQNTCINYKPIVSMGAKVEAGDVIADGSSVASGELALGKNLLVAFMSWSGFNYEDSIIISERVVSSDCFTSIHIEEYSCIARENKLGADEITADIPNVGDALLSKLDKSGIVYIGAEVVEGDLLVGKVTPRGDIQTTPEERLLKAIFGEKASDVKDTSLRVPAGVNGVVVDVRVFNRDGVTLDQRSLEIKESHFAAFKVNIERETNIKIDSLYDNLFEFLNGKTAISGPGITEATILTKRYLTRIDRDNLFNLVFADQACSEYLSFVKTKLSEYINVMHANISAKKKSLDESDDLPNGVLKIVKVYIAVKRVIQPGDKMAGRHGNKGVISTVVPVEDMPYMEDGTPIDIILNPLGVPSRMNVGQVLETHLGWAARALGLKLGNMVDTGDYASAKKLLHEIYLNDKVNKLPTFAKLKDQDVASFVDKIRNGVPMATPVFDGATESEIKSMLHLADLPDNGKTKLYDGRTGDLFDYNVTVGYMYMLKLNHLVDEKMHARSTGSYSLITQQPLGGRAQFGGQRFGEMEVWALEAYGAAYTLQEMLTSKSDDIQGRTQVYRDIIDGENRMHSNIPESFNVLFEEIRALGIDINFNIEEDTES